MRPRKKVPGALPEPIPPQVVALNYNPDTGVFTWNASIKSYKAKVLIGRRAGTINHYGYRIIGLGKKDYHESRLAWLIVHGCWPDGEIDHINCDPADNRIANLRPADRTQNNINRQLEAKNTSGFKGVSWHRKDKCWRVRLGQRFIGNFKDPAEGHQAYMAAATRLYGEYARGR